MKRFYITLLFCFPLALFAQPANDSCANAEAVTVTTSNSTINFDINTATINTEDGCPGTSFNYADVWYSFNMPVNGSLYIDGNIIWNNFGLYDGCNGNLLACSDGELFITNLSANTNLVLRVFRIANLSTETNYQSFNIQAFETPVNDTCESSITITPNIVQEVVDFNIGGSTINNDFGCSSATEDYGDVWYDFTMPFNGNIIINGSILWNKFEIYDTCSGTSLQCGQTDLFVLGLTANTDYKIRVYRNTEDAFRTNYLSFTIQAFEAATNDDCTSAETLNLTDTPTSRTFNIGGSTIDSTTGCTSNTEDYADVWYQFTLNETNNVDIYSIIIWNKFELYNACNTSSLGCFEQAGTFSSLTAGTYFLRVFREIANASNSSFVSFGISKSETLSTTEVALSKVEVYPIPANEKLTVSSIAPISRLELYNLLGKKVSQNSNQNTINVSKLASGVYLLKIYIDNLAITKRIIID